MSGALVGLSLLGTAAAVGFRLARQSVHPLPAPMPPAAAPPAVFLLQPIVATDAATLENYRAWLASAAAYPGRVTVVWSTLEEAVPALAALRAELPALAVELVATSGEARRAEVGVDKAHRLAAAMRVVERLAPGGGALIVAVDADVVPGSPDALARLVAAAPRPGRIASVTIPPLRLAPERPLWQRLQRLHARSLNQILAVGALLFTRLEGIVQGYCSVFWDADLRRLGGFEDAANHLGEDIALGVRAARAGVETTLFDADACLETWSPGSTPRSYALQQKRWSAMRRACPIPVQALMLVGLPLKLPVTAALAALALDPSAAPALAAVAAIGVVGRSLARDALDVALLPCEELTTVASHLWGLAARRARHGPWVYCVDARGRIAGKRWVG